MTELHESVWREQPYPYSDASELEAATDSVKQAFATFSATFQEVSDGLSGLFKALKPVAEEAKREPIKGGPLPPPKPYDVGRGFPTPTAVHIPYTNLIHAYSHRGPR